MKHFIYIAVLFALCGTVFGGDDCCDCKCAQCGCKAHCHKICHVVCEMKDVKKVCYCCKDVDVCIPGCSEKCGEVCEPNPCCQVHPVDCEACAGHHHSFLDRLFDCHHSCCESRTVWEPSCSGRVRECTKLMKYEVSKKVPTYKWVVEYCCDNCCEHACADQMQPVSEKHASNDKPIDKAKIEGQITVADDSALTPLNSSDEPSFLKRLESESQSKRTNSTVASKQLLK